MKDYWEQLKTRQDEWVDAYYAWIDQLAPYPQDWGGLLNEASNDVIGRLREAAEALVRYTAEVEVSADTPPTKRTAQTLAHLSHTLRENSRTRDPNTDWLSLAVDSLIQAADEQNLPEQPALPRGEHVILLHGLRRTNLSLVRLGQNLINRGYTVTNINYPSAQYPLEVLVSDYIAPEIAASPAAKATKLHFVTHSLGGILTRYYAKHYTVPNMGRVVMLGPPNQGSEIVDIFRNNPLYHVINGPVGLQLGTTPDSIPIQLGAVNFELGVIMGNRTVDPIFSIMIPGANDGKVSIARSQVEGMRDFIIVPHSHTFIMHSTLVVEQTIYFLQHGRFNHL